MLLAGALVALSGLLAHGRSSTGPVLSVAPPAPPLCPVEGGVVDPTRCAGYSAEDATAALQAALHSGAHTVLVRNLGTPWLVTSVLWLGSNQTLLFSPGAVIEAKRWAAYWNDTKPVTRPHPLLSTGQAGSTNVTLQGAAGAALRMHKRDYMNSTLYPFHNEWRYGLHLSGGSRHIQVYDLTIASAGGDGICLSYAVSDIHIARVVLDDNCEHCTLAARTPAHPHRSLPSCSRRLLTPRLHRCRRPQRPDDHQRTGRGRGGHGPVQYLGDGALRRR